MHLSEKMRNILIVIGLYILTVGIHMIVISQQGELSDETFRNFRHLEAIGQTGLPLFTDTLSMGGSESVFNPLLLYAIFPLWSFASSTSSFLLMISILVSTTSIFLYLFLRRYEARRRVCFVFALLGSANPLLFGLYTQGLFISALYLPITLLFFLAFFSYTEKSRLWVKAFLILILTASIAVSTHVSFALIVLFVLFTIFVFEKKKIAEVRKELFLYLALLFLFVQYLVYQSLFTTGGLAHFFSQTFLQSVTYGYFFNIFSQIVLPFLLVGLYAYYRSFRIRTNPQVLFSFCLFTVSLFLFMLKIQYSYLLLIYAFFALVLTAPYVYHFLERYWRASKFSKQTTKLNSAFLLFFILFISVLTLPLLLFSVEPISIDEEQEIYQWITEMTPSDSTFFVFEGEANKFMYYTQRKTFVDSSSFQTKYGTKRIAIQTKLYESHFESFALKLIRESQKKQGEETYILWGENYDVTYGVKPPFLDGVCFPKVYNNTRMEIYKVNCLEGKNE